MLPSCSGWQRQLEQTDNSVYPRCVSVPERLRNCGGRFFLARDMMIVVTQVTCRHLGDITAAYGPISLGGADSFVS